MNKNSIDWFCKNTWLISTKNTAWCLLGCSIGDFGTIYFFQISKISFPIVGIMILAIINGLITSIILETLILLKQKIVFKEAFKTALNGTNATLTTGILVTVNYFNHELIILKVNSLSNSG